MAWNCWMVNHSTNLNDRNRSSSWRNSTTNYADIFVKKDSNGNCWILLRKLIFLEAIDHHGVNSAWAYGVSICISRYLYMICLLLTDLRMTSMLIFVSSSHASSDYVCQFLTSFAICCQQLFAFPSFRIWEKIIHDSQSPCGTCCHTSSKAVP